MIDLYNAATDQFNGSISEADLQVLIDSLEEESSEALALAVVLLLMPFVHGFTAGNRERPNRLNVVMQPVLALVLAGFWVGLVLDQMPCFLRVPNCD